MICIVAGHGVAMLPFALPVPAVVSLAGFALGGLIYGPYSALAFTRFQALDPGLLAHYGPCPTHSGTPDGITGGSGAGRTAHSRRGSPTGPCRDGVAMITLAALATALWILETRARRPARSA